MRHNKRTRPKGSESYEMIPQRRTQPHAKKNRRSKKKNRSPNRKSNRKHRTPMTWMRCGRRPHLHRRSDSDSTSSPRRDHPRISLSRSCRSKWVVTIWVPTLIADLSSYSNTLQADSTPDTYYVMPGTDAYKRLADDGRIKRAILVLGKVKGGELFVWELKLPDGVNSQADKWSESRLQIAKLATTRWLKPRRTCQAVVTTTTNRKQTTIRSIGQKRISTRQSKSLVGIASFGTWTTPL